MLVKINSCKGFIVSLSYAAFTKECIILWVEESAWIYFVQSSNTKTRTECKIVIIEASKRGYQSRCWALLVLNKFHFYFLDTVIEFSCWIWAGTWLQECNWNFRNQHESNCSKSAIAKLELCVATFGESLWMNIEKYFSEIKSHSTLIISKLIFVL